MNPYTAVIAQAQLQQLRADAAEHRLARAASATKPRRSWFATTFASTKATVTSAESPSGLVPKLTGYPYRG